MMSDVKQVKVDNWGIYFLQRLKHFFNRTDYCDLTLQFQDNAQLKVHRLVLNACTEYFELLERTCEMYEDCLVMPDDLQADVVVPIINFMYTGQLEFKIDSLEKLYQTSLVMNMPVLTKLLEAHRNMQVKFTPAQNYTGIKRSSKSSDIIKTSKYSNNLPSVGKRSFSKAFENYKSYQKAPESNKSIVNNKTSESVKSKLQNSSKIIYREKKYSVPKNKSAGSSSNSNGARAPSPIPLDTELYSKKFVLGDPRPTRYELPEELDTDNIFENSFSKLSYTSAPLMVHPETSKQYSKRSHFFTEASGSKKGMKSTTVDIVECKKISKNDNLFEDDTSHAGPDDEMFQSAYLSVREENNTDSNQLFDQILDEGPKVTIEGKDKQTSNLDHAKIISEVLKKYPHLVKGNKNIKLKILNTSTKKKPVEEKIEVKPKTEVGYTYETDVLDSKEAAKLIAMGAANIRGPWICLICGTPGRALNFSTYYNFRRHLVEVHNEKPVSSICEYCGLRSTKRNYLLHHIYTRHGVPPPPHYNFPKCNVCDYIALTEAFLIKHKLTHSDGRTIRCVVCSAGFSSSQQLLNHVQKTGHQYHKDKKPNLQCVYCMKVFLRESNYYVHLKTSHREVALRDGVIEDSDEERQIEVKPKITHEMKTNIKYEQSLDNEYEDNDMQYQLQQKSDMNSPPKKSRLSTPNMKHKILNPGFSTLSPKPAMKPKVTNTQNEYGQDINSPSPQANEEDIVLIDGKEYIMKENQLIPKKTSENTEYILSELVDNGVHSKLPSMEASITPNTVPIEFANLDNTDATIQQSKMIMKKATNINQPIQIVVSNEEEYKALMSSNHSIIFDDGDTNKTLTVLTAPHTNSMDNTAIELQNTQPGDMMIIQQDYPLNVTETAVSADSKYVVVYSHSVEQEDPAKQYQIITPEEIGAQFVQASEVMTQNYETVTTTTSVLDSHVIEAQMEESWSQHTTNDQVEVHVDTTNKIDEGVQNNQSIEQTVTVPDACIEELPDIRLSNTTQSVQDNSVTIEPLSHNIIASNSVNIDDTQHNTNQVVIEEIQNNTNEPMDVDISTEVISDREVNTQESEVAQVEPEPIPQTSNASQEDYSLVQNSTVLINSHDTQEIIEDSEEINESTEQEATNNTQEVQTELLSNAVEVDNTTNETITEPKVAEEIQNITSEWSEDEYDVVSQDPIEESNIPAAESEPQITQESEVEESIENIQQEMQKQLTHIEEETPVPEESINSTEICLENTKDTTLENEEPMCTNQVKITSLLNDWEDNDSQEENVSTIESEVQASVVQDGDKQPVTIQIQTNKDESDNDTVINNKCEVNETDKNESMKDDNIKSLVSDWDDEEEEVKE
ncbi:unnamed protein product [Chilo suppressalis]|uniref:Centrosome-associated zinc finger protein CP190 n=1 Tax=Chilo suppressalis TaxID=168631 RepID=A0ABN8L640_CHISP|nr:unnamed protein product [Chilo suppressalis]